MYVFLINIYAGPEMSSGTPRVRKPVFVIPLVTLNDEDQANNRIVKA